MISGAEVDLFLEKNCGNNIRLIPLAGDGSTRRYFRVLAGDRSMILCHDENLSSFQGDDYPFFIVHDLFERAGVPVPRLLSCDRQNGLVLQEDLGDLLMEEYAAGLARDEKERLYREVVHSLCAIQSIPEDGRIPFKLFFDREKLLFEFEFFITHTLCGYLKKKTDHPLLDELRAGFSSIADMLQRRDWFVLNHRDFHSRNIMIHEGRHRIIDFQDARMGLPQYDLASLLRDSYIRLDDKMYESLLTHYYDLAREIGIIGMERNEFDYYMDIMAFQRNVKALGSFGWLVSHGKGWFEKYIGPTFLYLGDYARRRNELRRTYEIINEMFTAY